MTNKLMSVRGCLGSGNANNDANAGASYSNANNSPSIANANIGSRLECNTLINKIINSCTHKLCLLAKNRRRLIVLVVFKKNEEDIELQHI